MKILLIVPTFPDGPAVHPKTEMSIANLVVPENVDMELLRLSGDDPNKSHYENLRDKHNMARKKVLDEDYDYLLSIEADMIVPQNLIEGLLAVDKPIAHGLYCGRMNKIWLCFEEISTSKGKSIIDDIPKAQKAWGKVIKTEGVGFGCTLIKREVLEKIEFRLGSGNKKETFADDWFFAVDTKKAGFEWGCDLSLVCGHIRRDESEIWPIYPEGDRWWKITNETELTAQPNVKFKVLVKRSLWLSESNRYAQIGETIIMDRISAAKLAAKRVIEILDEIKEESEYGTDN